jgi:hypothetical protein
MHLLKYTHSELHRIDMGNQIGKTNSALHPYVTILETRDQPGPQDQGLSHAARRVVESAWVRGWLEISKKLRKGYTVQ